MGVVLVALVGIQFFPAKRNQNDAIPTTDFNKIYDVSESLETILTTSCYDCHSNNTNYPWYNKIQPITWFLENHIEEGKAELNFSRFGTYSKRRKRNKLRSIINQIEKDEMPLSSYTLIHRDAKLSKDEKENLLNWLNQLKKNIYKP